MKKVSLILIFILISQFAKAQDANAVIFSENGEKFTVYINGVIQNLKPESSVKIKNMQVSQCKMKIIFEDVRLGETGFNLFLESDMERTFALSKNSKGKYVMRFINAVAVTNETKLAVDQQMQNQDHAKGTKLVNKDTLDVETNPNVNVFQSNTNVAERPVYLPGYTGPIGCERPVSEQLFLETKNNVATKSFEETKLTTAKQLLINQCLLTSQVKDLVKLFTCEETKLEFAKYAYTHVYDIANYYKITDVFTFESSVEELNAYINSQR